MRKVFFIIVKNLTNCLVSSAKLQTWPKLELALFRCSTVPYLIYFIYSWQDQQNNWHKVWFALPRCLLFTEEVPSAEDSGNFLKILWKTADSFQCLFVIAKEFSFFLIANKYLIDYIDITKFLMYSVPGSQLLKIDPL